MSEKFPVHIEYLLKKRYFFKDHVFNEYYGYDGIENWEMLCRRVAKTISKNDKQYEQAFFEMLYNREFLPNSPTLFGAGVPGLTLSACFVIGMEDSIDGWAETFRTAMKVQTKGGGCGFPLHKIRYHGAKVHKTMAKAAGPIEFARAWNEMSKCLRQAVRSGANMGILRCDHPDIVDFIKCKQIDGELSAFNISVGITDKFMQAVEHKQPFELVWDGNVISIVNADELWHEICSQAHATGEPGIFFIDTANRNNEYRHIYGDMYPNPCAEYLGFENSACNLGSINITKILKIDGNNPITIDFDKFSHLIKLAHRFLDDLIDVNTYPTEKIDVMVHKFRPVGLGIMGLADLFLKLGIVYGSDASVKLTRQLMKHMQSTLRQSNIALAEERGPFPAFHEIPRDIDSPLLRNYRVQSVAPTGSISQIAGCSQGIEPHFSFESYKRIIDGVEYEIPGPEKSSNVDANVCASDISVDGHLAVLAAVQEYVDMSVSKTINLPSSASVEDVQRAYKSAYQLGIKGLTVYRDGCRSNQIISKMTDSASKSNTSIQFERRSGDRRKSIYDEITAYPRPDPLEGITRKIKIGCGNLYITVNSDKESRIVEVFVRPGKYGGCSSNVEALGRMSSLAFRSGIKIREVIDQLKDIRCMSCLAKRDQGVEVKSCSDAIAKVINEIYDSASKHEQPDQDQSNTCPECGLKLRHEGGCINCVCGFQKCG